MPSFRGCSRKPGSGGTCASRQSSDGFRTPFLKQVDEENKNQNNNNSNNSNSSNNSNNFSSNSSNNIIIVRIVRIPFWNLLGRRGFTELPKARAEGTSFSCFVNLMRSVKSCELRSSCLSHFAPQLDMVQDLIRGHAAAQTMQRRLLTDLFHKDLAENWSACYIYFTCYGNSYPGKSNCFHYTRLEMFEAHYHLLDCGYMKELPVLWQLLGSKRRC